MQFLYICHLSSILSGNIAVLNNDFKNISRGQHLARILQYNLLKIKIIFIYCNFYNISIITKEFIINFLSCGFSTAMTRRRYSFDHSQKKIIKKTNKIPRSNDKNNPFCSGTMRNRFGKWSNALIEAGIPLFRNKPLKVNCENCNESFTKKN
jgi:hypothetical protein